MYLNFKEKRDSSQRGRHFTISVIIDGNSRYHSSLSLLRMLRVTDRVSFTREFTNDYGSNGDNNEKYKTISE